MKTDIIIKTGGKQPGSGRPKGLAQNETLYNKTTMSVPVELVPSFKMMMAEWKRVSEESFRLKNTLNKISNNIDSTNN